MDKMKFDAWADKVNVDPNTRVKLYAALLSVKNQEMVDGILTIGALRGWSVDVVVGKTQIDIGQPARVHKNMRPAPKKHPQVQGELQKTEQPSSTGKADKPNLFSKMWNGIKNRLTKEDKAEGESKEAKPAGKFSKKTLLVVCSGVLLMVILGVVGYSKFFGGSASPYDYGSDPLYGDPTNSNPLSDPSIGGEQLPNQIIEPVGVAPSSADLMADFQQRDPDALDWGNSSKGLLPIHKLELIEMLGVVIFLFGDGKYRKQLLDAIVTVVMAALVIFQPAWIPLAGSGALLTALIAVFLISFAGGRDYTPAGGFFLLVAFGGLIFSHVAAIMTAFHIVYAPVYSLNILSAIFAAKQWEMLKYPLAILITLVLGTGITVYEAVRPSEDKNPMWGTVLAGGISIGIYFVLLHTVLAIPWVAYLVSSALAIGLAALSQNERLVQVVTFKWGIRNPFDAAMLVTAVLILIQIAFGIVG